MKLLRNVFLLAGLLLGGHFTGLGQVFDWVQLARNAGNNTAVNQGGTTDLAGNTYVGFGFRDSARVGGQRIVRTPGGSILTSGLHIIKYDSLGRVVWIKAARGVQVPLGDMESGIKAGPANTGFFITGVLQAGAVWNGVPIPAAAAVPAGQAHGFYGRCDASGNLLWTRPLPSEVNNMARLMADGLGNCYLSGDLWGATPRTSGAPAPVLGGAPIDSTELYLVGNNSAGTGEWSRRLRATPKPYVRYERCPPGVYLSTGPKADGGCLLFGSYNQRLFFNGTVADTSLLPLNTFKEFIATVSPTGGLSWIRPGRAGGTINTPVPGAAAAAADAAGNYYVTGGSAIGLNQLGYQNTVIGVAKYSSAGTLLWVCNQPRQVITSPSIFYNYNNGSRLVVDRTGEVTILAFSDTRPGLSPPAIGNFELREPYNLIHLTAAGVPQWVAGSRSAGDVNPQRTFSYNELVSFDVDAGGSIYYATAPGTHSPNNTSGGNTGLTPPTFLLGQFTQVGAGISVARIGSRHNTLRGRLYLDANGNGVRDGSEGAFPRNMAVQCIQPTYAPLGTFDATGYFNIYTGAGAYTLPAPPAPPHYALSQPGSGSYTGSFAGYGGVDTARHFGYRPIANQADLRATLTPYGAARPGFLTRYRLTVENVGTTTVASGTATVTLDARAAYVSSTPAATRSGQTLTWAYTSLAPFARREFDVQFSLPVNTTLGTVLTSTAAAPLAADVVPADNTATATQTVTGSFDPNDIQVNYTRLTPAQVAAGQPLDYTIRFQNMGTDTAFTVVIKDTLNFRKLNLGSLMLVAQSHNCLWSLSGQGELTVRFLNIRLPHRSVDVIRSQGFVRFRVLPKATLVAGDIIPNHAHITFDYNAPIRTNTATTAVLLPTAVLRDRSAPAWNAYPNPAAGPVTVAAELAQGGPVQVQVLDALGRAVLSRQWLAPAGPLRQTFDLGNLAPGLYHLRLTLPDGYHSSQALQRL